MSDCASVRVSLRRQSEGKDNERGGGGGGGGGGEAHSVIRHRASRYEKQMLGIRAEWRIIRYETGANCTRKVAQTPVFCFYAGKMQPYV